MDTDEIEFQHIECTHLRVARLKLGRKRRFNLSSSNTTPTAQKIRVHPVHPWFLKLRRLVPIGFGPTVDFNITVAKVLETKTTDEQDGHG